MLAVIAIPAGLLIGISLGALGGGGSILTVPALVYLLHQQPHAATTGSLLIVGITALAGMVAHWRAGRVRLAQGTVFGALGIAGSYVGTRLSASVRPDVLLALFAVLMLVAAGAMLRRSRRSTVTPAIATEAVTTEVAPADEDGPGGTDPAASGGSPHPGGQDHVTVAGSADRTRAVTLDRPVPAATGAPAGSPAQKRVRQAMPAGRALKVVAAATTVGLLTGFFGVGGGFVIVPALVLALGFEMATAVGTSLLVIAINSAAALVARTGESFQLDWPLIGVFVLVALGGTLIGNWIASRVSSTKLSAAFTVLLIGVAIYTLIRSVGGLL